MTISIGEYYASREPAVISTLLGSCVAVCLFDPKSGIGGMNHILLPGRADLNNYNLPARFGINAMELLINAVMALGADRCRLRAKVFGGACVIPGLIEKQAVGQKLASFVLSFLEKEGIGIISRALGGTCVRNVKFHTRTGDAYLKQSHSLKTSRLVLEEQKKFSQIRETVKAPMDVTIF
ncbi:MAG: chemotaxis protein CheD [Desulfobacteraceae bacterium]|nr:chemotaxis protein CheD [Desulfobacteraceae bacterium]